MSKRPHFWRKAVASIVAYTLAFGQIAPVAFAAPTDISDIPLAVKTRVSPNIMMTLDDSGSMQWEFLPEEEMRRSIFMFPRPANPYGGSTYDNDVPNFSDTNVHNFYGRSSNNNKLFYNPNVTYLPWSNPNGSFWADANPNAAYYNPANPATGTLNLVPAAPGVSRSAEWFSGSSLGSTSCNSPCPGAQTFWPITYFKYKGTGSLTAFASYNKIQITNSPATSTPTGATTFSYTITNPDGTTTAATRTRAEEIQNFANWFQYQRSRISAARAGISRAFATLDETPRVGFAAINEPARTIDGVASPGTVLLGVRPFVPAARKTFFDTLFNLTIDANGTPLRQAMDDVGQYFSRTDDLGPWGTTPGTASAIAQLSCRQNYHILMTDGYWNDDTAPARAAARRANVDGTASKTTHIGVPDPANPSSVPTFTYSKPANPFSDNFSDTLADVAMYYWLTDLRPTMTNNVFTNQTDPAFWQHVTTFGVALGVFGTIPNASIQAALLPWLAPKYAFPTVKGLAWPDPTIDGSTRERIDDLAHAGVNSRGGFFSASDPNELARSLSEALANISTRESATAAVGVTSANVISGDNLLFSSNFLPGVSWTGDLRAFPIDVATGLPSATKVWSAQEKLDLMTTLKSDKRLIATYDPVLGVGIPFQTTTGALSAQQKTALNTPALTDNAAVVNYLRGHRFDEIDGVYRQRNNLLGDIVGAQPVVVRPPEFSYTDLGYPAFKKTINDLSPPRTQLVLQGANDGMLHAFDAGTARRTASDGKIIDGTFGTGEERWAYIPSFVIPNLNNLSRLTGYVKKSYVNATPVVTDVDFSRTGGAVPLTAIKTDWRTIVAGGLGSGGRGIYALDVTAVPADEAGLKDKVLWEFPNASNKTHASVFVAGSVSNMGLSFGRPIITKTRARGWVVIVASGYNNGTNASPALSGDGRGSIFVLNAKTGDLIQTITTGQGTAANPSGLAHITGYAENSDFDNTVEYVYGGDLEGSVWRFDLTHATDPAQWTVTRLARLVDAKGMPQPVSSEVELSKVRGDDGVMRRFVYVGTGLLLGDSDSPAALKPNAFATQMQTMYGLVDDLSVPLVFPNPVISAPRTTLVPSTLKVLADGTGNRIAASSDAKAASIRGWFIELPGAGERVSNAPVLGVGALVFTSNEPSLVAELCTPGGSSYLNIIDFRTGGNFAGSGLGYSSLRFAEGLASGSVLIRASGAVISLTRVDVAGGTTVGTQVAPAGSGGVTRRRSWRELLQ